MVRFSKLVASKKDYANYVTYVFLNIEDDSYFICVKLPNWQTPPISIGDRGFVKTKEVIAGETSYYNISNKEKAIYRYDNIYFENFVKEETPLQKLKL